MNVKLNLCKECLEFLATPIGLNKHEKTYGIVELAYACEIEGLGAGDSITIKLMEREKCEWSEFHIENV